jgi:hypothetical protein
MAANRSCDAERERSISSFQSFVKTRFLGGVYPGQAEGPHNDITTQSPQGGNEGERFKRLSKLKP